MNQSDAAMALERLGPRAQPGRLSLEWAEARDQPGGGGHYAFLRDRALEAVSAHTDDFGMQWTELFDDYRHDRYKHIEQFMRLGLTPMQYAGATVLDAGMGLGRHSETLLGTASLVVGCDLSAAVHTAARYIDNARFIPVQASIANLPFTESSFDHVFSWGVVHHCPDPMAALDDLWRVLKPGGTLAVWVYADTEGYRRRSYINWHLKDFDRHDMLQVSNTLTNVAHMLQLTSPFTMTTLASELWFSVRGSKEYTRHILYDGLGPDYHHLITPDMFAAWARRKGVEPLYSKGAPLGVTFTKPA